MGDIETIHARRSVRTYLAQPLEAQERQALVRAIEANRRGPFGTELQLELVDVADGLQHTNWTYGVIRGAQCFVAGAITVGGMATVDFGWCLERVILEATRLSLGTCWLGGTFSRGVFAERLKLREGDVIPCVTPVGRAADKKSLVEKALRSLAGSNNRKDWSKLFFVDEKGTPLSPEAAGRYREALECVRLAPSASNGQPWRVVADAAKASFHFGLVRKKLIDRSISTVSLQEVDLGIALSHFDLACRELGLLGSFTRAQEAKGLPAGVEYIATWNGTAP